MRPGQGHRQVGEHLAHACRTAEETALLLGPDDVEPALHQPPPEGLLVLARLEHAAQGPQVGDRPSLEGVHPAVGVDARDAREAGRGHPPETGGRTATSSAACTGVPGSAGSPFTHTLHVGSSAANPSP